MKRRVFVGSSSEALDKAQQVCELLGSKGDTDAVPWTEVFQPGYLTFEALEAMLLQCCGAVFVATPDDQSVIRGRTVNSPRANIMLEFGLVAGRMGRHNIALCQYGGVELPSDLQGLTAIAMDPPLRCKDPDVHRQQAEGQLALWSSRLVATADRIPRTEILHGYTGRWDFNLHLSTWRDLVVPPTGYVEVKGYLDLIIPAWGQTGRGLAHGALFFRLPGKGSRLSYQGEFRTAHEISNAHCLRDGSLDLTTEAFALQRVSVQGEAPPQLVDLDFQPEPWSAKWRLSPSSEPRTLTGEVHTEGAVKSVGTATLVRRVGEL